MSQQPGAVSEIARLREQITREREAACWARTGLAVGAAKHWFITRRMECIGTHQQRLSTLIGEEASIAIVAAVMEYSPPQLSNEAKEKTDLQRLKPVSL